MSTISWQKRLKYNATPWRQSNKERLTELLSSLVYWNDNLYNILPVGIRDSALRHGILGHLLVDPDESNSWASLQGGMIGQQARFNLVYSRLSSASFTDVEVQGRLIPNDRFNLTGMLLSNKFSFLEYNVGGGGKLSSNSDYIDVSS